MEQVLKPKTKDSYKRIGEEIVVFLNRSLDNHLKLNPAIGYKQKIDNYNISQENVDKINTWLK